MGTREAKTKHIEQSLLPMIAKMSTETFHKLPYSERCGISVADLVAEAKYVVLTKAAKTYNPMKQVKFSTYAYKILENHFKCLLRDAYASKRCAVLLSLDYEYKTSTGEVQTLYDRMARSKRHIMENKLIARIDAERAFIKAYTVASPKLRKYLISWLLQPKPTGKLKEGKDASAAMVEFKLRSVKFLTLDNCETIQTDYACRSSIANLIASRFFTPRNDTCTGYINFTSRRTIEHALLPILSPERRASIVALVD